MLIVIDGGVDIPEALERTSRVRQVPGRVWTPDGPLQGGRSALWPLLRTGQYPSTAPPTVNELADAYQHDGRVLAVHVSGQLSTTVARAREAAAQVGANVVVMDTRSLSVGAGLIVTALVQKISEHPADLTGSSLPPLDRLGERLHTFALVQDVATLRHSDRASLLPRSRLVHDHPLVLAIRGRVVPLGQPRDRRKALDELASHVRTTSSGPLRAWSLGHGEASDVSQVIDRLSHALGSTPQFVTVLGPNVGAHLGPDALVVGALSGATEA